MTPTIHMWSSVDKCPLMASVFERFWNPHPTAITHLNCTVHILVTRVGIFIIWYQSLAFSVPSLMYLKDFVKCQQLLKYGSGFYTKGLISTKSHYTMYKWEWIESRQCTLDLPPLDGNFLPTMHQFAVNTIVNQFVLPFPKNGATSRPIWKNRNNRKYMKKDMYASYQRKFLRWARNKKSSLAMVESEPCNRLTIENMFRRTRMDDNQPLASN